MVLSSMKASSKNERPVVVDLQMGLSRLQQQSCSGDGSGSRTGGLESKGPQYRPFLLIVSPTRNPMFKKHSCGKALWE